MEKVKYLKSAVLPADWPDESRPEVALAGRSNAGKSSFLNAFSGHSIAHVSSRPGKTALLNFFDVGAHYRFVDMPGFGFADQPKAVVKAWSKMIENYLDQRENLVGLILFVDVRRDWGEFEQMLDQWTGREELALAVALTKIDKLKSRELEERIKNIKGSSGLERIFPISSEKKSGIKDLEDFLFQNWIKPFVSRK